MIATMNAHVRSRRIGPSGVSQCGGAQGTARRYLQIIRN
jgi:hypothetical protein